MPYDTRKARHIAAKFTKIRQNRTQSIQMTCRLAGGGTTTLTKPAIWRPNQEADPTTNPPDQFVPGGPKTGGVDDIVSEFLASDITLTQLRSVLYGAPTVLLADEPATRYLITSITPKGIAPGGDRYTVTWTRQR